MTYLIGFHCYYCGYEKAYKRAPSVCPKCHRKIIRNDESYFYESKLTDEKKVFAHMKKARVEREVLMREPFEKQSREYVEKSLKKLTSKKSEDDSAKQKIIESGNLKEYVGSIIKSYGLIYYLQRRLQELEFQKKRNSESIKYDREVLQRLVKKEYSETAESLRVAKEKYISTKKELDNLSDEEILDAGIIEPALPVEPVAWFDVVEKPELPSAPDYVVVKWYNKKSATAENQRLRALYDTQKEAYDRRLKDYNRYLEAEAKYKEDYETYKAELEEYERQTVEYKNKIELLRKQKNEDADSAMKKQELEISRLSSELDAQKKDAKQDVKELINRSSSYAIDLLLSEQIKETKARIEKTIKGLKKLYDCGVIYPKYQDYVSVCTFYEYLDSGRCDSLEGPHGAYNLYEADIKANIIMTQLDQIIDRLDEIKENQNAIYSMLKEIDHDIGVMSMALEDMILKMNQMSNAISDSSKTLSDIRNLSAINAENTASIAKSSAATAYFSAENAYWSKKNAELTNAMGFLVAMK